MNYLTLNQLIKMEEKQVESKTYTEEQLVQFGYYLLSEQRTRMIKDNTKGNHKLKIERLKQVYDADIANFEHLYKLAKETV